MEVIFPDTLVLIKLCLFFKSTFFWPKMFGDVQGVIVRWATCQKEKSTVHQGLYTPLTVPEYSWEDISMDL